jgi:hypothetical protein
MTRPKALQRTDAGGFSLMSDWKYNISSFSGRAVTR